MYRFFLILNLLFFQSFSQNQYSENGNRDGLWRGYYESGELKYEGSFDDGTEVGLFKYYYKSGNLEKELFYIESGVRALVRIYYSNKNIKTMGEYCLKKRCGTWEYFDDLGNIILKENYMDDILNGPYFVYLNGKLSDVYNYKDGKKNGFAKSFFLSGKINTPSLII